jgi:hypothetical protein
MSARTLAAHLRRYPLWYALGAVWLIGVLALPIVKGTALADVFDGGGSGGAQVAAGDGAGAPSIGDGGSTIGTDGGAVVDGVPGLLPETIGTVAKDDDEGDALEIVPPEVLDAIFDALPPLVFPAVPRELEPLTNAIAPLAAPGCSGLGLGGVVVAVAAQTAEGVPLERLLPYLAPASTACAAFPLAPVHTVCEADQPFVQDLGGLTTTPPILGLGIDEIRAFETLMANQFGTTVPSIADELSKQLSCRLVS